MYGPTPGAKIFCIVIYREMLKKSSSQEPLGQFQSNLVGNMPGGMGIHICLKKRAGPFWGPIKGQHEENFDKSRKNLLMNHCIDI